MDYGMYAQCLPYKYGGFPDVKTVLLDVLLQVKHHQVMNTALLRSMV
jgi:hypothetical protein